MESEKPQDTVFVNITDITDKKAGDECTYDDIPKTIVRYGLVYHYIDHSCLVNRVQYELTDWLSVNRRIEYLKTIGEIVDKIGRLQSQLSDLLGDDSSSIFCIFELEYHGSKPFGASIVGTEQECRQYLLDNDFVICVNWSFHRSGTRPSQHMGWLKEYTIYDEFYYTLHSYKETNPE